MFPSELATGLCSLNPHVDRLVQSCLMEVDRRGHGRALRDARRRHQQQRADDLHGGERASSPIAIPTLLQRYAPLVPMFELMRELFQILNDARRRRGSIDFDLNEAEVVLDEGGAVEAIIASQRNVAHRLIEEFMLLANETVASYLEAQDAPALHRIHEEPDVAEGGGVRGVHLRLRLQPRRAARRRASAALPETDRAHPRQAGRAADRVSDAAHDAEGAVRRRRTSVTSAWPRRATRTSRRRSAAIPISSCIVRCARRATELTDEEREEWNDELPEIARHTSEMERRADEAERELLQWKKVKFMADKVGDEFEGYVTGVAAFGLFIELDRALRRGPGPHLDDGRRLLSVRRERAYAARREHQQGVPARGQGAGPGGRVNMELRQSTWASSEILERYRRPNEPRGAKVKPKGERKFAW